MSSASLIWSPTRCTGFQEFMAPWKTMAMSFHRRCRISSSVKAIRSVAVEPDLTRDESGVVGEQPQQRERHRGLATPRLPHQADRLPLVDGEADVLDRRNVARLDLVPHHQLVDLEQRLGRVYGARREVFKRCGHRGPFDSPGAEPGVDHFVHCPPHQEECEGEQRHRQPGGEQEPPVVGARRAGIPEWQRC